MKYIIKEDKMNYLKILFSFPKSLYVNFHLFPFKQAIKLPLWVTYNMKILISGGVVLKGKAKPFMIRIGFHECNECDSSDKTVLRIDGKLVFEGNAHIGKGSKLIVYKGGLLELGDNFAISASTAISCRKHIKFGKDIQFSWDCLVMDSDTHTILDEQGYRMNPDKEIVFEDKVWIGNGCMILKGAHIPDNCVIGARSVVAGSKFEDHSIIVGNPAKSVKKIGGFRI